MAHLDQASGDFGPGLHTRPPAAARRRDGVVRQLPPLSQPASSAPLASAGTGALLEVLRAREPAAAAHSEAVAGLARRVATELSLARELVREVELTALLHDVGKLGVPDAILDKPAPLNESERAAVRRHADLGERILRGMPGLWQLGPLVRACHERWDGRGYPDGLRGEEIPLASRIVFACDSYDAIVSERVYCGARPSRLALDELAAAAGSQLCPASAAALLAVIAGPFRRFHGRCARPPAARRWS